jgi:RNA polymerase sigma-70 factor (ECF subfamily)
MSYQEIGETMGLSVPAIKSLLMRARVNLKNLLEPYIHDGAVGNPASPAADETFVDDLHGDDQARRDGP